MLKIQKLMNDKKAISPLIATLLLLSFAISIAVVFMNFGRAQVELEAECPVKIGLAEKKICLSGNQISLSVSNGINIDINGLIVNVIGTSKADTFELNNALISKGGIFTGSLPYQVANSGVIRQIKISPKITLYDQEQICIKKAIVKEDIPNC
jgi:flagellin-like protein